MSHLFYTLFGCTGAPPPGLTLDGPSEVRVSELGRVDGPRVVASDGVVLLPGLRDAAHDVDWALSRDGVARLADGQVIAEGPGQVSVSAEWEEARVEWTLKVELHTVVWIVDPPTRLKAGEVRQLAVAAKAGGVEIDPGRVFWTSSEPRVVAVDPFGIATANEPGTSYLTVQTQVGSAMIEVDVGK